MAGRKTPSAWFNVIAAVPAYRGYEGYRETVYRTQDQGAACDMADWFQAQRVGGIGYPAGTEMQVYNTATGEVIHSAQDSINILIQTMKDNESGLPTIEN